MDKLSAQTLHHSSTKSNKNKYSSEFLTISMAKIYALFYHFSKSYIFIISVKLQIL